MALTEKQQSAKNDTIAAVKTGSEDAVASMLKENYELLRLAFPQLAESKKLANDDYRKLAREAIEKRSVGGISLDAINEKLMANAATKSFIESRGAKNLNQIVPTTEQITAIANEAGEAVAANIGEYKYGTTNIGYAIKGLWSGGAAAAAGDAIKADAQKRLAALAASRSDIAIILPPEEIAHVGDNIKKGVIEAASGNKGEKPDTLALVKVKPIDAATRDAAYSAFSEAVYHKAESGITSEVEKKLDGVRNNGILGFIFKILEFLGLEKLVAGLFGMQIPEKDEIRNASRVVAESARETVEQSTGLSKSEMVEAVRKNTYARLKQNQKDYSSFNDEQLMEMATKSSQGIGENYDLIPKISPIMPQVAHDAAKGAKEAGMVGGIETAGPVAKAHTPANERLGGGRDLRA